MPGGLPAVDSPRVNFPHVQSPRYSRPVLTKCEMDRQFFGKTAHIKYNENPLRCSRLVTSVRTDRRTE